MPSSDLAFTSAADLARMIRAQGDLGDRGDARHAGRGRRRCRRPATASLPSAPTKPSADATEPADEAITKGWRVGPLHGVPFHAKDMVTPRRAHVLRFLHVRAQRRRSSGVGGAAEACRRHPDGPVDHAGVRHMPYTEAPLFGRTRDAWAADPPAATPLAARRWRWPPASARSASARMPAV